LLDFLQGPLDYVQALFDPAKRERRSFEKLVGKLVSKNYQHEDRMLAIETLSEMDTPQATTALFRRWDMSADKDREDRAEKEYLAQVLVAKGERMLPMLRKHLDRSLNVTWPLQVMRQVSDEYDVVTEILRVLAAESARLASFKPEKKVHLIRALWDQNDERTGLAVVPLLDDFDETVRYEAAGLIGRKGDASFVEPLVNRIAHEDEDSARVRGAILEVLVEAGWRVSDHKDKLAGHLGDYIIGHAGALQKKPE
jgi:HEAT repeat protein